MGLKQNSRQCRLLSCEVLQDLAGIRCHWEGMGNRPHLNDSGITGTEATFPSFRAKETDLARLKAVAALHTHICSSPLVVTM